MTRYDELVSLFMDGDPTGDELSELAELLRNDPVQAEDFREQLLLWEVWSQENAPERSAEAFMAAFQTRRRAEADAYEFELSVTRQLKARKNPFLFQPVFVIAAVLVLLLSLSILINPAEPEAPQTAAADHRHLQVRGECVCTHCTLNKTKEHNRAIRYVRSDGETEIVYLVNNPDIDMQMRHFCRGPTPVLVEGDFVDQEGPPMLAVANLEFINTKSL